MKLLQKHLVLAVCLVFSASAMAQLFGKKGPPEPVAIDATVNRSEAFAQLITDGAALRHVPKPYAGPVKSVAIGSVTLDFATDTETSSRAWGNASGVGKSQRAVNYKLLGLSPEALQAVADAFEQNLRQAIKDQGYPVIEQDKLLTNAAFAASVAEAGAAVRSDPSIFSKNGSIKVTAKGTADLSGMSGAFKEIALSKSLDDALVVRVALSIDFARFADTSSYFKTHKAEIEHQVQFSVALGNIAVMQETGSLGFGFMRRILLPTGLASKVTKLEMTGGDMAKTVLLGMLSGTTSTTDKYEVTPVDNYAELATADLKVLAEVLAQSLKKQ